MSEDKTNWNLPFSPEFTVDAEGIVRKGGKPLPSHGLVQAIKNMIECSGQVTARPSDSMTNMANMAVQGDQVVPFVLLREGVARDGKPSALIDRERMEAAQMRSAQWTRWRDARAKAIAEGKNPPPAPKPPVTRARMIPSVEPYPAHGDLTRGWVVLELSDGVRVLLHGPSVAAMAPEFTPWK
jgi:hypothetical protein